ncbi:MAG TPA: HAMP domain-containing protein, partial [Nitriliruptorales bacterium]|nr:HAMP domain-containing protein [Nitriliruptorales bacterium]
MTLRVRLTLYFTIIVVLPLTVAGLAARFVLVRDVERRVERSVDLILRGIAEELELIRLRAGDVAEDLASPGRGLGAAMDAQDREALRDAIDGVVGRRRRASVVVVTDPSGRVLAARTEMPRFLPGVDPPTVDELADRAVNGDLPPLVVGEVRAVEAMSGRVLGWVLAARWFDQALAQRLADAVDLQLTLVAAGRPVATTDAFMRLPDGSELPVSEQVARATAGSVVRSQELDGVGLVASRSPQQILDIRRWVNGGLVAVLLLAVLTAAVLGWLVAQMVVRPVEALAEAAGDVAAGDLDRRIDVEGGGEISVLGEAFNTMTAHQR